MKNKKFILIALGVITGLIVIYFLYKKFAKPVESDAPAGSPTGLNSTSLYKSESFPLGIYMKGENVKRLQNELNRRGASLSADGFFGVKTQYALLQIKNLKTVDEAILTEMVNEPNPAIVQVQQYTSNPSVPVITSQNDVSEETINQYVENLYKDLVLETYFYGRTKESGNGIYTNLATMPNYVFTKIYGAYKNNKKVDLSQHIKDAFFNPLDNIDKVLLKRAYDLGLSKVL